MTAPITPALTAEEWAEQRIDRRDHDTITLSPDTGGITVADGFEGGYVSSDDRHALAALALHGQPFGFTWDDVRFLRHEAAAAREMHGELIAESFDFDALAARIEALLPPEGA